MLCLAHTPLDTAGLDDFDIRLQADDALDAVGYLLLQRQHLVHLVAVVFRTYFDLDLEGILLTMYDARTRLSKQVVEEVRTHFMNLAFNTLIHSNIKLAEAPSYGISILEHDINSIGSINYLNLAKEVLQRDAQKAATAVARKNGDMEIGNPAQSGSQQ